MCVGGEGLWAVRRGSCGAAGRAKWHVWPCEKVSPRAWRQSPPQPHVPTVNRALFIA